MTISKRCIPTGTAELSRSWNKVLEAENRMQDWRIAGVPRQQNFYNEVVKPQFNNPQIKRVFVIISDALRYEVAEELGNQINTENLYCRTAIPSWACYPAIPSWVWLHYYLMTRYATNRVMAISFYADRLSTSGTLNRDTILKKI